MKTHCPQCGSGRVRRSRHRSTREGFLRITGARLCRCHECNLRLIQFGGVLIRRDFLTRARKQLSFAFVLLLAMALIMGAILWFGKTSTGGFPAAILQLAG